MALLPDLATAGGIALAVFLVALGVLVLFVESVPRRTVVVLVLVAVVLASALVLLGELGIAMVALAFAAAFVANDAFEWLTTR